MSIRTGLLAASLSVGLFASVTFGQHHEQQSAPGQSQTSADSVRCARAQVLITGTVDAAMARLETARQANSPAQMRAAVDDLQGALRDVRVQLSPCAAMQQADQSKPAATSSVTATDSHAGHRSSASPATKPATAMDPVTGLSVDPSSAPKATYQGQIYYFSSEDARKEFVQNPAKFARKPKQ